MRLTHRFKNLSHWGGCICVFRRLRVPFKELRNLLVIIHNYGSFHQVSNYVYTCIKRLLINEWWMEDTCNKFLNIVDTPYVNATFSSMNILLLTTKKNTFWFSYNRSLQNLCLTNVMLKWSLFSVFRTRTVCIHSEHGVWILTGKPWGELCGVLQYK